MAISRLNAYAGGLVGEFVASALNANAISTCFARVSSVSASAANISGTEYAGGLVGNSSAIIEKSYYAGNSLTSDVYYGNVSVDGTATTKHLGGLVGYNTNPSIAFNYVLLKDVAANEGLIVGGGTAIASANEYYNLAVRYNDSGSTTLGGTVIAIGSLETRSTISDNPYRFDTQNVWTYYTDLGVSSAFTTPILRALLLVFGLNSQN